MAEKFNINDPEALNDTLFPLDYRTDENANEQEHGEIVGDVLGDMPVIIEGLSVTTGTSALKFKILAGVGRDIDGLRVTLDSDQDDQEPATVVEGAWNYIAIKHIYTYSDARLAKGSGVSYNSRRQDSCEIDISASEQLESEGYIRLTKAKNVGGVWEFDTSYRSRDISGASAAGFTTIPTSLIVEQSEAEPEGKFFGMSGLSGQVAETLAFEWVLVPVVFDPEAVHPEGIRLYEAWAVPKEGGVIQHHKQMGLAQSREVTVGEDDYHRVYVRVPAGFEGRFQGRVIAGNGESSGIIESADVDLFSTEASSYTIADADLQYIVDPEGGVRLNVKDSWVTAPAFGGDTRAYHWYRKDGVNWIEVAVSVEPTIRWMVGPGDIATHFGVRPRHKRGYYTTTYADQSIDPDNPNIQKYMESISDGASTTQEGKQVIARRRQVNYHIDLPGQGSTEGNWYAVNVPIPMPFDGYIIGHKPFLSKGIIGLGDVTKLRLRVGLVTKEFQIPEGDYSLVDPWEPDEQTIDKTEFDQVPEGTLIYTEFQTNDTATPDYRGGGLISLKQGD